MDRGYCWTNLTGHRTALHNREWLGPSVSGAEVKNPGLGGDKKSDKPLRASLEVRWGCEFSDETNPNVAVGVRRGAGAWGRSCLSRDLSMRRTRS